MNKEVKDQLAKDIERQETELVAKKMLLKQLNRKPPVPFMETRVGRAMDKSLVFMTKPFVSINTNAQERLQDPKLYRCKKTLAEAEKLISYCQGIILAPDYRTQKVAVRAARMELRLTEFAELPEYQEQIKHARFELVKQVTRLRTTKVEERQDHSEIVLAGAERPLTAT